MPEPAGVVTVAPTLDTAADEVLTRILDAAATEFIRHGVRRTSIDTVARRARVGRNTVFRRLGSKDELVRAVLTRHLHRLFADLDRVVTAAAGPLDRVVAVFATTVTALRADPMMRSALEEHPDEIVELTEFAGGELMRLSSAYVAGLLCADRDSGNLSADLDVEAVAETVVRLVHSIVLVPHLARPLESDAELRTFAAAVFRPHLEPATLAEIPGVVTGRNARGGVTKTRRDV